MGGVGARWGGESKETGAGASVRRNGEAGWVKSGSTGASAGFWLGFCSVIAPDSKARLAVCQASLSSASLALDELFCDECFCPLLLFCFCLFACPWLLSPVF